MRFKFDPADRLQTAAWAPRPSVFFFFLKKKKFYFLFFSTNTRSAGRTESKGICRYAVPSEFACSPENCVPQATTSTPPVLPHPRANAVLLTLTAVLVHTPSFFLFSLSLVAERIVREKLRIAAAPFRFDPVLWTLCFWRFFCLISCLFVPDFPFRTMRRTTSGTPVFSCLNASVSPAAVHEKNWQIDVSLRCCAFILGFFFSDVNICGFWFFYFFILFPSAHVYAFLSGHRGVRCITTSSIFLVSAVISCTEYTYAACFEQGLYIVA